MWDLEFLQGVESLLLAPRVCLHHSVDYQGPAAPKYRAGRDHIPPFWGNMQHIPPSNVHLTKSSCELRGGKLTYKLNLEFLEGVQRLLLAPRVCLQQGPALLTNVAHIRQSGPDSGRGFQTKVLETFQVVLWTP